MKPSNRTVVGLVVVALVVVGLSIVFGPHVTPDVTDASQRQSVTQPSSKAHHLPGISASAAMAGSGAEQPVAPEPVVEARVDKSESPECRQCRTQSCTNYKGSGIDFVKGCFNEIDPREGADTRDAAFIADCVAAVSCASRTGCASSSIGAARCYCGSITVDDCAAYGPGPDAPCADEWQRATRTTNREQLNARFSDLKYPSGWAMFMIECEQTYCKSACG